MLHCDVLVVMYARLVFKFGDGSRTIVEQSGSHWQFGLAPSVQARAYKTTELPHGAVPAGKMKTTASAVSSREQSEVW